MSWAPLVNDLQAAAQGHGGEELTFSIVVREGMVREILQPTNRRREPRGADHLEARLWWSIIRRLQSVGNGRSYQVEIRIDLDLNDNPTSWREPEVRNLEPYGRR